MADGLYVCSKFKASGPAMVKISYCLWNASKQVRTFIFMCTTFEFQLLLFHSKFCKASLLFINVSDLLIIPGDCIWIGFVGEHIQR